MAAHSIYQSLNPSRQEIRLIEITPFDPADKLSVIDCKLHVVSLFDKPEFIALSYAWGDPTVTTEIIVNGAPFDATVNLYAALRQAVCHSFPQIIREDGAAVYGDVFSGGVQPRPEWDNRAWWATMVSSCAIQLDLSGVTCPPSLRFWADAICINQADPGEKSSQIPLMGAIYSTARLVVGSLGYGKDPMLDMGLQVLTDVCNAFASEKEEMIRQLSFNFDHDTQDPEAKELQTGICREFTRETARDPATKATWRTFGYAASTATIREWIGDDWEWLSESYSYLLSSPEHWMAFCALSTSAFFSRVWTVQERNLAKSLILVTDDRCFDWGKHRYDMLAIGLWDPKVEPMEGDTLNSVRNRRLIAKFCRRHFPELAVDAMFTAQVPNTSWWAHSGSGLEKEATDKRDHVYGLLAISKLPIPIDYDKPVGEVFAAMTMECLRKGSVIHLDSILALAGVGLASYTHDMPSWTPSPNKGRLAKICSSLLKEGQSASSGLFEHEQKLAYSARDLTIALRGVIMVPVVRERAIPDDIAIGCSGMLSFLHDVLAEDFMPDVGVWAGLPVFALMESLFPYFAFDKLTCIARNEEGQRIRICSPKMALAFHLWLDEPPFDGEPPGFRDELRALFFEALGPSILVENWPAEYIEEIEVDLLWDYVLVRGQSLFVTEVGYVGRGPRGLLPGDVVAALEGSRMPVLLRDDGDAFRHVGTFYAYGLMDGEAARFWVGEGNTEISEIVLR
ncbi:hypothetical protein RB595_003401 [Gaeumannomyces hyphopodioides]